MRLAEFISARTTLCLTRAVKKAFISGTRIIIVDASGRETSWPLAEIRRVLLIGTPNVSIAALRKCLSLGVPVDWLDGLGNPVGKWLGVREPFCALWQKQAAWAEGNGLALAKKVIVAKIESCQTILRRRVPVRLSWGDLRQAVMDAENFASLRGYEGIAGREYFSHWECLLAPFAWHGRHPRPAPDAVNLLLSFGYSILRGHLASSLASAGLDPRLGFFHEPRGSHSALASDLMEPLRALVDTTVLALIRRKEIKPENFRLKGSACVCANNQVFTKLLAVWENMFAELHVFKPYGTGDSEKFTRSGNDILDDMADSFASCLRGEGEPLVPVLC